MRILGGIFSLSLLAGFLVLVYFRWNTAEPPAEGVLVSAVGRATNVKLDQSRSKKGKVTVTCFFELDGRSFSESTHPQLVHSAVRKGPVEVWYHPDKDYYLIGGRTKHWRIARDGKDIVGYAECCRLHEEQGSAWLGFFLIYGAVPIVAVGTWIYRSGRPSKTMESELEGIVRQQQGS